MCAILHIPCALSHLLDGRSVPGPGPLWHTSHVRRSSLLTLAALVMLQLPWLGRPVDMDEANFLVLTRGAAADPWRPHDVWLNWQGTAERAFDVLSNPPGIAWWLVPVADDPVPLQRAWMLPWLVLAVIGAGKLARRFAPEAELGAVFLVTAPIAFLSTTALLPDAPLYALTLLGVGGFVEASDRGRDLVPWALVAGAAALFRYSAVALAPLLVLYQVLRGRPPWSALAALLPLALLGAHDLDAYGALHLTAMGRFQSVSNGAEDWLHKGTAAVTMLGGAAALPLFRWRRGALAGAATGALLALPYGLVAVGFGALGGAGLGTVAARLAPPGSPGDAPDRADGLWLSAWAFGGLLLLLGLRFMATRYWLPFLPGVMLALPLHEWPRLRLGVQVSLCMLLAFDAADQAAAVRRVADQVAALGTGGFTGHWGWQWELEQRGWKALDEGAAPPPGSLVAMPREAWPQPVEARCTRVVWEGAARPRLPWLPRGYSSAGGANLHANWVAGEPPRRTVIPWTFANDPYERVRVCAE